MNRREIAEENWRRDFKETDLINRFEFIHRDWTSYKGHKVLIKCKTCGSEFLTLSYNEIRRGRQSRLICPECGAASDGNDVWGRSSQADEAMAFYTQGHTVRETAERFNVSVHQINSCVKIRGLTNGRRFGDITGRYREEQRTIAVRRISGRLSEAGFEYVGGYTGKDCVVQIKCKKCGAEYERTSGFLNNGKPKCIECQKRETQARERERKRIAALHAKAQKIEREQYRLAHPPKDSYTEQHEAFLNRTGICEICGRLYTVREYVESCGLKIARDNGVCSDKCRRIKINKSVRESRKRRHICDSHRHRAKKYGGKYDPSITLRKLVARDGLRCALCGDLCDWNDNSWSEHSGPTYPSIDHIIPMSKGGGHTWDNVQVAHIVCNSKKGA